MATKNATMRRIYSWNFPRKPKLSTLNSIWLGLRRCCFWGRSPPSNHSSSRRRHPPSPVPPSGPRRVVAPALYCCLGRAGGHGTHAPPPWALTTSPTPPSPVPWAPALLLLLPTKQALLVGLQLLLSHQLLLPGKQGCVTGPQPQPHCLLLENPEALPYIRRAELYSISIMDLKSSTYGGSFLLLSFRRSFRRNFSSTSRIFDYDPPPLRAWAPSPSPPPARATSALPPAVLPSEPCVVPPPPATSPHDPCAPPHCAPLSPDPLPRRDLNRTRATSTSVLRSFAAWCLATPPAPSTTPPPPRTNDNTSSPNSDSPNSDNNSARVPCGGVSRALPHLQGRGSPWPLPGAPLRLPPLLRDLRLVQQRRLIAERRQPRVLLLLPVLLSRSLLLEGVGLVLPLQRHLLPRFRLPRLGW